MVPKLVCSLIRHNTHQHGDKPVCVQLFDENRMLHASVERLVKENDKSYIGIQAHKLVPEFATEKDLTPYLTNDKITYYHIELEDQNEWLFANGVPVESWQK